MATGQGQTRGGDLDEVQRRIDLDTLDKWNLHFSAEKMVAIFERLV